MTRKTLAGDKSIEAIKLPTNGTDSYRDGQIKALYLNVTAGGVKTWYVMGRIKGQPKLQRYRLGHYAPASAGHMSLAKARKAAMQIKERWRMGEDPKPEQKRAEARKRDTFADMRDRFIRQYAERNLKPNTVTAYKSVLNSERLKAWESLPVKAITRGDVIAVIDAIADEGREVMANRTLAYLRKFFNWCAEKDIIKTGEPIPTDRVKPPLKKENPRGRYLSAAEIRLLWETTADLGYPYEQVYRLFLTTGQRKTECAELRRQDIGGNYWTQKDNKPGREHIVPLNRLALETIASCPIVGIGGYVFTTRGDKPINGFSKSKARLDQKMAERATRLGVGGVFDEPWQIHDLRRTIVTHLREAGITRDVCSLLLNHAEKGVTAEHYDKYDMLAEKNQAMDTWASLLNQFIRGAPDKVVRYRVKSGGEGVLSPVPPSHKPHP